MHFSNILIPVCVKAVLRCFVSYAEKPELFYLNPS